jgi:hypothetical protein
MVSFELWSTIASVGTFLVIAATAVVAIIQLRHTRSGNQIAAAMTIHSFVESQEFQEGRRFIRDELVNLPPRCRVSPHAGGNDNQGRATNDFSG